MNLPRQIFLPLVLQEDYLEPCDWVLANETNKNHLRARASSAHPPCALLLFDGDLRDQVVNWWHHQCPGMTACNAAPAPNLLVLTWMDNKLLMHMWLISRVIISLSLSCYSICIVCICLWRELFFFKQYSFLIDCLLLSGLCVQFNPEQKAPSALPLGVPFVLLAASYQKNPTL